MRGSAILPRCSPCSGNPWPPKPDVVIKTPADVWLAVSKGQLDGTQAFMTGKYQVEGNMGLLLKLKELFSR
jgi:putative sterol carrier protein